MDKVSMKVVKVPFNFEGEDKKVGDDISVLPHVADRLKKKGLAEPVSGGKKPAQA